MTLDEVRRVWTAPLEGVFPASDGGGAGKIEALSWTRRSAFRPARKFARPAVLIPVFPGTNCEMDSKRAFERAGALVNLHILRNLDAGALASSISEMAEKIRNSQIVMIPGGFSGGDEPDGSAKFITAVFRNPAVAEAAAELLERRDGLMLGICNGFQALIKLGLLPFGRIRPPSEEDPTLACNSIGRHVSRLVRTRVASVLSPWLAGAAPGDIHTIPVSHGEGRFTAPPDLLRRLIEGGADRHAVRGSRRRAQRRRPLQPERIHPGGGGPHLPGRADLWEDGPFRARRAALVQECSGELRSEDLCVRRGVF
jgi:phosphoribosylformylglycinamidine synthase